MRIEDLFPLAVRERERAEELRLAGDLESYRKAARDVVDLVLTDDTVYMDALPDEIEVSLVPALDTLAEILDADVGDERADVRDRQLLVAAMAARASVVRQLHLAPPELRALVLRLPPSPGEEGGAAGVR
ncbi:hypothetical protein [Streptomyces radicis]|uniref:Uncharacterized protein n=1 Tax=Streptomyces radicis TaxID=1750517 RepID=A0A3A9WCZ4_9ACTN|nr:hypothetical protein [Streptomyces radicis]RKN10865.1 hypothetical protein D7319_06850 [Streptomyces radicis]RKN25129.1 hypothetical protein D7318_07705 [Streptomyces radicis]